MNATTTVLSVGNGENQASRLSPKRTKLASPVLDDPDPASTSVDHIIMIDNEECDDIVDLSKIQEMALRESELGDFTKDKDLQISRFASEQAVHHRQAEFLKQISAAGDTTTNAGIFSHICSYYIQIARFLFIPLPDCYLVLMFLGGRSYSTISWCSYIGLVGEACIPSIWLPYSSSSKAFLLL